MLVLSWWRKRQKRKRSDRWLADVIRGMHVHDDSCCLDAGGMLVPLCEQEAVLVYGEEAVVRKTLDVPEPKGILNS